MRGENHVKWRLNFMTHCPRRTEINTTFRHCFIFSAIWYYFYFSSWIITIPYFMETQKTKINATHQFDQLMEMWVGTRNSIPFTDILHGSVTNNFIYVFTDHQNISVFFPNEEKDDWQNFFTSVVTSLVSGYIYSVSTLYRKAKLPINIK